ncbi:MAG: redoxin domain-containing protein, partial [Spirochaetales bacterium]|nr:redoxin domain-containing protein [Spirochaetales bacterium]
LLIFFFAATFVSAVDEGQNEEPSAIQNGLMQLGFQVFREPVVAPDFTLENLNGEEITLSSLKGKVVLLNFWATWCPPCRAEMPSMQEMYLLLEDENFELLAVDVQEPKKTVADFIEKNGYTFPILLDTSGRTGAVYGARSIPTTYIIDADGFAVGFITGSREWNNEVVYETLRSLLPKDL